MRWPRQSGETKHRQIGLYCAVKLSRLAVLFSQSWPVSLYLAGCLPLPGAGFINKDSARLGNGFYLSSPGLHRSATSAGALEVAGDGGWLGLGVELPVGRDMAERNPELAERERLNKEVRDTTGEGRGIGPQQEGPVNGISGDGGMKRDRRAVAIYQHVY
ncbi:hypothetical protein RRG08_028704 [Elysia crispata]|uniref:Uncharacterized protein n=1 Tax=Elysia crispata TaxID=231223 RepID=A0AAE1CJT6_9GAST|nr:hypothetical protein RRG08_028704 [Elysia crispata]